jgi:hypothetical protein
MKAGFKQGEGGHVMVVTVRRLTAIVLMALVVTACGSSNGPRESDTTTTTTSLPGAAGEQAIAHDVTAGTVWGGNVSDTDGASLRINQENQALLSFPPPPITQSCYERVTLRLWLENGSGDDVATISAYPSAVFGIASLKSGSYIGRDNLVSNRPRTDAQVSRQAGWIDWDITELTHKWANGERFGDATITPDPGSDVVISLRPPVTDSALRYVRQFTSTEGIQEHRPRVVWQAKPGCTKTS